MVFKLFLLLLSVSSAEAGFRSGTIVTECGKSYIAEGGDYEALEDVQITAAEDILLKECAFKAGNMIEFNAAQLFKAAQLKVEALATTINASKIEVKETLFNGKTTLLGEATLSRVEVKGTLVVSGGCKAKHLTATILTVTEDGDERYSSPVLLKLVEILYSGEKRVLCIFLLAPRLKAKLEMESLEN